MPEAIAIQQSATRLQVTLNRSDRGNALDDALVDALNGALDRAEKDGIRIFVICGTNRNFCTGFDLSDIDSSSDANLLLRFVNIELLLQRIHHAPFTTVAIAAGRAIGAGADLFMACERRVVVGRATFAFPGAGFGIVLGFGRLAACVGAAQARELIQSGRTIDTAAADRLGMTTHVVMPDELDALIERETNAASRLDPIAAGAIREIGRDGGHRDLSALVRSAARPGLRERMITHRDAVRAAAQPGNFLRRTQPPSGDQP